MILHVNGSKREVRAEARTLLDVLREDLGLVGTKEGCGVGMCGACTVLVDGEPISSCIMLAEQAVGKEILTVEGLGSADNLHPVQQAFLEEGAFQCAYCTPGFVLTTIACWKKTHPQATRKSVSISPGICAVVARTRIYLRR